MTREKQKVTVNLDIVGERSGTQLANIQNPLRKIFMASIMHDLDPGNGGGSNDPPADPPADPPNGGGNDPSYDIPTIPPSVIIVSNIETNAITLEWNSVQYATSYSIFWASEPFGLYRLKDIATSTSYRVAGLYPDSTYFLKVAAKNTYGQSPQSSYIQVKTSAESTNGNGVPDEEDEPEPPKTFVNHYIQIDDNEPHFIKQTTGDDPTIIANIQLTIYKGFRTIKYYNDDSYPWKVRIMLDNKRTSVSRKNTSEVKVYIGKRIHFPVAQPVKRFSNQTKTRTTPVSGIGFTKRKRKN